ncbi:MAG: signal recognition particle-docking protein FtsY [Ruminococcaceae bacterium]|nr:signal recognition particle-docking protein FtsY [Oscillospiraceae bacterium]
MGIFKKINFGLTKTRNKMAGAIDDMLDSFDEVTDDLYTELEEILVMGDVGVTTAVEITEKLREEVSKGKVKGSEAIRKQIKTIVADMLYGGEDMGLITVPSVILVIGVNGVGKTTTIGKMAAMYKAQGKSVILGAADTFRAAAIDQLQIWADRSGVDIVKHKEGADPAAVVFDTISAAKARDSEIIIIDTAGRLHNKKNLMDELNKIYRVIDRELPYSDREVLLVLDATTGQNAVNQAREFKSVADITGIVLTKLDGTARGGVVLAIKNELGIPVKFIGVGEQIDDLQPFKPEAFADGLFDKIDYKEEEDIQLEISEEIKEEHEEVNENLLQEENTNENGGAVEDSSKTDDEGYEQEEEVEPQPEEKEEKKKRGFFGLFNRNS